MINMSQNQLRSFAKECVSHYAKFDRLDGFKTVDIDDLPHFIKHEFAAMLISEDDSLASEATGADNQHWQTRMLPALTKYLKNSTSQDEAIEFNHVWRDCVADYVSNKMQELLDGAINE